eukprot:Phypoly_transcript_17550.p1 GENE.Phypoly_transcript_17550~~Phypoly_transcript_17550.p1  ORF type:complete len:166 (+),score=37.05 Phypoly_transcript_17550:309-806(+)
MNDMENLVRTPTFVPMLTHASLRNLVTVNKEIFKILAPYIAAHFCFTYRQDFNFFTPHKIKLLRSENPKKFNLSPSITHVTFNSVFPQMLSDLPPTLTHLKFGDDFNTMINAELVHTQLTHVEFGRVFNQPIFCEQFPSTLTHLTLNSNFNKPLFSLPLPSPTSP